MVSRYTNCRSRFRKKKRRRGKNELFFYHQFPPYEQIQLYIRKLAQTYPGSIKVETIGYTFQGRKLDMIIIKKDPNIIRSSVLIDAGIHAREWIAVTSVLYIISQIVRQTELLNLMDFYIIPTLNPDGYIYTHNVNRLWRKNMNHNCSRCITEWGVDLNRNFPFHFGQRGSSIDKKSFKYRGVCPLSEKESQALAKVMEKYGQFIKLYISFHAYGNCILYPWGFSTRKISDQDVLHKCACAARNAMYACKKRNYRVGSMAETMYITSGCTADYAKGCHKIKFSYTIELQKYGRSGFTPGIGNILEIGKESMECLEAMMKFVDRYYKNIKCQRVENKLQVYKSSLNNCMESLEIMMQLVEMYYKKLKNMSMN